MNMEQTYTYTARNAIHTDRVVTFTLFDDKVSVSPGAPLEQIEAAVSELTGEEGAEEATSETELWLKPMAISLVERGTAPLSVADVNAQTDENWLEVQGWVRIGGLRLFPLTLTEGPVDNPDAAQAFVNELQRRKRELTSPVLPLDYWFTWLGMATSLILLFVFWRRRASDA